MNFSSIHKRKLVFLILFTFLTCLAYYPKSEVYAQSGLVGWERPVNLSQSGAASQPRIVAGSDGKLQAFWLDKFDGLVTSVYPDSTTGGWSVPTQAPLPSTAEMPELVVDRAGWVHAFWIEGGLMHSQMEIGNSDWSFPEMIADSVLAYHISIPSDGGISLVFLTSVNNSGMPAGVYTIYKGSLDKAWKRASLVYESIYFRLLTPQQAWVYILDEGGGKINVTWEDPRLEQSFYASSSDQGLSWNPSESLGKAEDKPVFPKVVKLPDGGLLRLWQASQQSGCSLYRQLQEFSSDADTNVLWEVPEVLLEGGAACPQGDHFYSQSNQLYWLWGEGASVLSIAAWNTDAGQWSDPRDFSFNFYDSLTESQVTLSDLHFTMAGDSVIVVGWDVNSGEVWVTKTADNAIDLVQAPSSPWASQVHLSNQGQKVNLPSMAMDQKGHVHLVWSQSASGNEAGSIFYSFWDGQALSIPVNIIKGAEGEIAIEPWLIIDSQEILHLVWSGGTNGEIYHSRSPASEALSPSTWTFPTALSSGSDGSYPQIVDDDQGNFYVIYAVRHNENRGVYLVRSTDWGDHWSQPVKIFDGAVAGWQMVEHPTLAVDASGNLHAAWVNASLPGTWSPRGIFYAVSSDRGNTWSEPLAIVGKGYDWPRLAVATGQLHLLYSDYNGTGVWHRFIRLDQPTTDSSGWEFAARVPGWNGSLAPFSVAVDGRLPSGTLHLIGSDATLEKPLYSFWDGRTWSRLEAFSPATSNVAGFGAASATRPEGGLLAAAWLVAPTAGEGNLPEMYFITRAIPQVEVLDVPKQQPSATPTAAAPVETSVVATPPPTPTPQLNSSPVPSPDTGFPPLILSGGLAAAIVVGALITRRLVTGK